jgi:hypothetical protein
MTPTIPRNVGVSVPISMSIFSVFAVFDELDNYNKKICLILTLIKKFTTINLPQFFKKVKNVLFKIKWRTDGTVLRSINIQVSGCFTH